jgi:hypothetical protein
MKTRTGQLFIADQRRANAVLDVFCVHYESKRWQN